MIIHINLLTKPPHLPQTLVLLLHYELPYVAAHTVKLLDIKYAHTYYVKLNFAVNVDVWDIWRFYYSPGLFPLVRTTEDITFPAMFIVLNLKITVH